MKNGLNEEIERFKEGISVGGAIYLKTNKLRTLGEVLFPVWWTIKSIHPSFICCERLSNGYRIEESFHYHEILSQKNMLP